jgi:hypothetical protein
MSSNSVPWKKGEIPEDGLSRIQQQMKFMFGELMTRIEKLKTRSDGGCSKKGREARKEESDTIKKLMSYPKCRSVEVINNPARQGSNHREVNYIEL